MSALSVEHGSQDGHGWDELVRLWQETDAPEGCKVEIIEGIVTVAPPPSGDHGTTAARLQRRLYPDLPEEWELYQNFGLSVPGRKGLYIPDLSVLPVASAEGRMYAPAEDALLVVEITSPSNGNHDRITKVHGYAHAGVPLYLLLDPWNSDKPTATLYGEPDGGTYRMLQAVEYGGKLTLPEPFELDIDTGVFPVS